MGPRRVLMLCLAGIVMLVVATVWPRNREANNAPPIAISSSTAQVLPDTPSLADTSPAFAPRPIARIAPGTRMGDTAPEGWTHLIFKAHNRLDSGDTGALLDSARHLAEFVFSVMAVRVGRGPDGRWQVEDVGMGLGAEIKGEDVIITPETEKSLGANLGLLELTVLKQAEKRLEQLAVVGATGTMLILDAPSLLAIDGRNRETVFRYLFIVNPDNGHLAAITWRIEVDPRGNFQNVASQPILTTPNLVTTTPLHVDGKYIALSIPTNRAFASSRLPPGVTLPMPPAALPVATRRPMTQAAAAQLETAFRDLLAQMVASAGGTTR